MVKKLLILILIIIPILLSAEKKTIHTFVALCDRDFQGLAVSKTLGNGQDPDKNLYWGAAYGIKVFFKKSSSWKMIKSIRNPEPGILERVVFKHRKTDTYMIADAYDGRLIKRAIKDFFIASSGAGKKEITVKGVKLPIGGGADLISYIGHDGLMDFGVEPYPKKQPGSNKDVIVLSCASRHFFTEGVKIAGANPIVWTSDLMAPEAYTLVAAIEGWIKKESAEKIRLRAAKAYAKYQKCSVWAAKKLIVTGFDKNDAR